MEAPDTIKRLVDTFQRNIDVYKNDSINETQLRREFLDPFFTVLGWDVENKSGYADAYKDVIHEYSLKTKDVREAPDYCFRIGGTRKFFVEAKKPFVNVKDDIHPAFQLRSCLKSRVLDVTPVKTGIQKHKNKIDSHFRGNDNSGIFTFETDLKM